MYKLNSMKYVLGIDFETANRNRDSACSVGLYLKEFNTNNVLIEKEVLINPEQDFDYFNSLINGMNPDMVADSPNFTYAYSEICKLINEDTVVVGHNASFDMSVLRRTCERYSLKKPSLYYLDTLLMAKKIIQGIPSYSLDNLACYFDFPDFNHHNAFEDAKTCIHVFEKLMGICECTTPEDLCKLIGICLGEIDGDADYYTPCGKYGNCKFHVDYVEKTIDKENIEFDESHPFYNKVVVFTGTLKSMSRDQAKNHIKLVGGTIGKSVTLKTNYLICGYQNKFVLNGKDKSNKLLKAEKYASEGIELEIVNEPDFLKMV